jgi:hypothetical protein
MLPARWSERYQAKVAESLGFDPENPMVKMEMASIIRRGMGGFVYPSTPFGYQEIAVGEAPAEAVETLESTEAREPAEMVEITEASRAPETPAATEESEETAAPEPNVAPSGSAHGAELPPKPTAAVTPMEAPLEVDERTESTILLAFLGGGTVVIALAGLIVFFKTRSA